MSGPKVIRVVTREERLAQAMEQIASLIASIERYAALGRQHDVDIAGEIYSYRGVVAELQALMQANAWSVIAERSADALSRVDYDRKALEERLLAAAERDRTVRRRLKEGARTVQREARALNIEVTPELEGVIASADNATPGQLTHMEAVVMQASRMLVQATTKSRSQDRELAMRLTAGLNITAYADWRAREATGTERQNTLRLDKILAEVQFRKIAITDEITAAINRIERAPDESRDLLIDSLIIELNDLLKQHQRRRDEARRIDEVVGRLERENSAEAQNLIQKAPDPFGPASAGAIRQWESEAEECLKISRAKANANHQRKALLSGLVALGYEVREGMATALVENGRLVVKKPAEVEYGVEIVSGASGGQLQVRMVSFQSATDPTRDRDVEVIWCGEFAELQARLKKAGHDLKIEKALAPGKAPMKRQQLPLAQEADVDVSIRQPSARTI